MTWMLVVACIGTSGILRAKHTRMLPSESSVQTKFGRSLSAIGPLFQRCHSGPFFRIGLPSTLLCGKTCSCRCRSADLCRIVWSGPCFLTISICHWGSIPINISKHNTNQFT
ncbi:hypothetical protein BDV40DRAFT_294128 [Aspergillus tamarii]|uniref:Uncharacterized protein n=1 Tax=Aspergillus tamarii TaxID=41984 RepID=A0A5N6UB06_ASPTM|nr:hypothetical protein BDV40DRAFT_294128 [Aspergillus tamarii]